MQFSAPNLGNSTPEAQVSTSSNNAKLPKQGGKMANFSGKKGMLLFGFIFAIVIIALQVIMILLIVNPQLFFKDDTQAVAEEIASLTTVNLGESPTIAIISDSSKLRDENAIQGQVYKDAQNGDYVLGYSDKMIIYRRDANQIIYEGSSPGQILRDSRAALIEAIDTKAKEAKIIPSDSEEVVQATVVTDPEIFQKQSAKFYADLRIDDVVGVYNESQIIVIYRQDTGEIIKNGSFGVDIKVGK